MKEEEKKVKIEVRKPFFRGDRDILRIVQEDGTVSYTETDGAKREIETADEHLELTLSCAMERLDALTELISEENVKISMVYGALINEIRTEIDEMLKFIDEDIGIITCTWIRSRYFTDTGRCVGAFVEPLPKKEDNRMAAKEGTAAG